MGGEQCICLSALLNWCPNHKKADELNYKIGLSWVKWNSRTAQEYSVLRYIARPSLREVASRKEFTDVSVSLLDGGGGGLIYRYRKCRSVCTVDLIIYILDASWGGKALFYMRALEGVVIQRKFILLEFRWCTNKLISLPVFGCMDIVQITWVIGIQIRTSGFA